MGSGAGCAREPPLVSTEALASRRGDEESTVSTWRRNCFVSPNSGTSCISWLRASPEDVAGGGLRLGGCAALRPHPATSPDEWPMGMALN